MPLLNERFKARRAALEAADSFEVEPPTLDAAEPTNYKGGASVHFFRASEEGAKVTENSQVFYLSSLQLKCPFEISTAFFGISVFWELADTDLHACTQELITETVLGVRFRFKVR
jgi:hypothetical protein